jgi:hypothetical protein
MLGLFREKYVGSIISHVELILWSFQISCNSSLLAARRPMLVLAIATQHLVSHPASINAPPTVPTQTNKVSILCFKWSNTTLAALRQQLSEMANGMAMVMANGVGNCDGRR